MSDEEAFTCMTGGPCPPELLSTIAGNAPTSLKEAAVRGYLRLGHLGQTGYGWKIRRRIAVHEVSLEPDVDDQESVKVVTELEVAPGELLYIAPVFWSLNKAFSGARYVQCTRRSVAGVHVLSNRRVRITLLNFKRCKVLKSPSYLEGFCHIVALDEIVARQGGRDWRFPNNEHLLSPGGTEIVCPLSLTSTGERLKTLRRRGDRIKIINRSVATGVDVGCCRSDVRPLSSNVL